jgi:manganese transport protein
MTAQACWSLLPELLAPLLLMWRLQVAYMDPGNWATAIEAGSRFGYQLVSTLKLTVVSPSADEKCASNGAAASRNLHVHGVMLQESLRFM